jgi:CRP-like cAMP-binding protein
LANAASRGLYVKQTEHLAQIAACFRCPDFEANLILGGTQFREYAHRAPVAFRGDVSAHLYLVLDGLASADLYGPDGQYARLAGYGAGELFGAYPTTVRHRADIVAEGSLSVLMMETAFISGLAHAHARIAQGISELMARQIDLLLDRMAARIGLSANGRFYQALLSRADSDGWIKPLPVVSAMAVGVNTTRETASRALAHLLRRGIVKRHDHGLEIVSIRMLEDLVI